MIFLHKSLQMIGEKRPAPIDPTKKPKTPKKKKKKDPNEPQKPVSAYALFFRDTQAAIKGQNPNATFGEVSKIVASMWDGLGEEQKQVIRNSFQGETCSSRCQDCVKKISKLDNWAFYLEETKFYDMSLCPHRFIKAKQKLPKKNIWKLSLHIVLAWFQRWVNSLFYFILTSTLHYKSIFEQQKELQSHEGKLVGKTGISHPSRLLQNQPRPKPSAQCSRRWPPLVCPQVWCYLHPSISTLPCHQHLKPSSKPCPELLPQNPCRWDWGAVRS